LLRLIPEGTNPELRAHRHPPHDLAALAPGTSGRNAPG
jgi:hypothetical protein